MAQRTRYTFQGRIGDRLYWHARIPGDSRVDQISADAAWFYGTMLP